MKVTIKPEVKTVIPLEDVAQGTVCQFTNEAGDVYGCVFIRGRWNKENTHILCFFPQDGSHGYWIPEVNVKPYHAAELILVIPTV